jgi:hypothetical protein
MKVIGIGLPRTGNTSLATYLRGQNLSIGQYAYLRDCTKYDVMVDYPMCLAFPVLLRIHPELKAILTIRSNVEDLYKSTKRFCALFTANGSAESIEEMRAVLVSLYGSPYPSVLDIKTTQDILIETAKPFVVASRCLVLPVDAPNKAQAVSEFLGLEYAGEPYPHENKS